MKTFTAKIKFLEPLMFRGPGEFDLTSRGVYSYASSMVIPSPSTLIGMLIFYLTDTLKESEVCTTGINSWGDLLNCYETVLNETGVEAIRGPYIYSRRKNEVYVPLMFENKLGLVEFSQLPMLIDYGKLNDILSRLFEGDHKEEVLYALKHIKDVIFKEPWFTKEWRLGIGLDDRDHSTRTAKEGYIYTVNYIAYPDDTEIRFKLILADNNSVEGKLVDKKIPVKLGGEHRIAEMTVEKALDKIDNVIEKLSLIKYALLISSMPIIDKNYINNIRYIGKYDTIGLGFSIVKGKRKPLYPTILEGSIVHVDIKRELDSNKLLKYGLYHAIGLENHKEYNILGRIGYSSFIPIP